MPIYEIACDKCGKSEDVFRSLAEYDNLPDCCGVKMHRVMCAPGVVPDIQPYKSMLTGEMIESRSKHRSHLKQHGCIEIGNEKQSPPKPVQPAGDIKKSIVDSMYKLGVKK